MQKPGTFVGELPTKGAALTYNAETEDDAEGVGTAYSADQAGIGAESRSPGKKGRLA